MSAYPTSPSDYQAEADAHTLAEAHRIEADGARLAKARACAHEKAQRMAAVAKDATADTAAADSLMKGYRKVGA
jgi:hypothetical protein